MKLAPELPRTHAALAGAHRAAIETNYFAARQAHHRRLETRQAALEARLGLGDIYLSLNRAKRAIVEYRLALTATEPGEEAEVGGLLGLGKALQAQGKLDQALACYGKAGDLAPQDAQPPYLLGSAYRAKGTLNRAIVEYQRAIALQEDYAVVHYELAHSYEQLGYWSKASAAWSRYLELVPTGKRAELAKEHLQRLRGAK